MPFVQQVENIQPQFQAAPPAGKAIAQVGVDQGVSIHFLERSPNARLDVLAPAGPVDPVKRDTGPPAAAFDPHSAVDFVAGAATGRDLGIQPAAQPLVRVVDKPFYLGAPRPFCACFSTPGPGFSPVDEGYTRLNDARVGYADQRLGGGDDVFEPVVEEGGHRPQSAQLRVVDHFGEEHKLGIQLGASLNLDLQIGKIADRLAVLHHVRVVFDLRRIAEGGAGGKAQYLLVSRHENQAEPGRQDQAAVRVPVQSSAAPQRPQPPAAPLVLEVQGEQIVARRYHL